MIVDLCLREAMPVIPTVVVIADNEVALHIQPGNLLIKESICGIFTAIGEVSGDDTTFGVAMVAVDVIDTAGKTLGRIQAVQLRARGNQVGVGDVYEFHMRIVFGCLA
jgi:hypothetical protein